MTGNWSLAMLADNEQVRGLRLPNTLELPPSHTAVMVGHFLQGLYAEVLREEHPRYLMTLIEKIQDAERLTMRSSDR